MMLKSVQDIVFYEIRNQIVLQVLDQVLNEVRSQIYSQVVKFAMGLLVK